MNEIVKLLTDRQVAEILGYSRSGIWALMRNDATFPRPIKLSAQATRWPESEILEWVESKREVA